MATLLELKAWARKELSVLCSLEPPSQVDSDTVAVEVDALLKHALKLSSVDLITKGASEIAPDDELAFREVVARRLAFEPVAYILGERDFYKHSFFVDRNVLIPRPETELVVELALKHFRKETNSFYLLDLCTGSGCIVCSVAAELEERFGADFLARGEVVASDISDGALEVARKNASRLGLAENCMSEFVRSGRPFQSGSGGPQSARCVLAAPLCPAALHEARTSLLPYFYAVIFRLGR